jgi:hypothetical protein
MLVLNRIATLRQPSICFFRSLLYPTLFYAGFANLDERTSKIIDQSLVLFVMDMEDHRSKFGSVVMDILVKGFSFFYKFGLIPRH